MSQFIAEARIEGGRLELFNVPFSDATEVKVFVIPKVALSKMSFLAVQKKMTSSIKGNLSDSISRERNAR
jgi:hypothetical protein